MALNTKNEIESVRDHIAAAYHALAGVLTSLNMAAEVWENMTPAQQRLYQRSFNRTTGEIIDEVRTGKRILKR